MSLIIDHLTKTYGKQNAVDQISFEVKKGEIVGFLGPNGAGKSTTMKIATCYIPPTSGKVEVCGFDVVKKSMDVRKNIGYLPENNPLYLDMYVKEYLGFIGSLHKISGKKLKMRVEEIITLCGLDPEKRKKIGMLSKGYRQRVGLAQALIHNPAILILDEPTTGLDPNQIVEIRNLIKNISQEKTIIFSSHRMEDVEAICNRAIIIRLGEIVADGDLNTLKAGQKGGSYLMLELDKSIDTNLLAGLEGVEQVISLANFQYRILIAKGMDVRASISKKILENNCIVLGMRQEETSLENVFQELTK